MAVLLGLAGGGLFAWRATHPIREVTRTARRIIEQGEPRRLFSNPENPRTQKFLQRIIESGRLEAKV